MAFDPVTLDMSKAYTKQSLIGLGALKGKPCTIKKTEHKNGVTTIIFEWVSLSANGVTEIKKETQIEILDGTQIDIWKCGKNYFVNDLCLYEYNMYICLIENSDTEFNYNKWSKVGKEEHATTEEINNIFQNK